MQMKGTFQTYIQIFHFRSAHEDSVVRSVAKGARVKARKQSFLQSKCVLHLFLSTLSGMLLEISIMPPGFCLPGEKAGLFEMTVYNLFCF